MLFKKKPPPAPKRPRTERRPDGVLYAVTGASRLAAKTTWTAQQLAGERRLLVWDYKGEWSTRYRCRRVTTLRELEACVVPSAPPARIAFHQVSGMVAQFDAFCRLAWVYVRAHGAPLIVEETASVTTPGKAPAAWGDICRLGLGFGSDIYALTQRPAESDKTALGNATVIHCGVMGTPDDRRTMAKYLDVDVADVAALQRLEWIERDKRTGELARGFVRPITRAR